MHFFCNGSKNLFFFTRCVFVWVCKFLTLFHNTFVTRENYHEAGKNSISRSLREPKQRRSSRAAPRFQTGSRIANSNCLHRRHTCRQRLQAAVSLTNFVRPAITPRDPSGPRTVSWRIHEAAAWSVCGGRVREREREPVVWLWKARLTRMTGVVQGLQNML